MISVSFGSNYKFDITRNYPKEAMDELAEYEDKGARIIGQFPSLLESAKTGVYEHVLVSSPDKYDYDIETILKSRGIDFHKQTKQEAMELKNIKNRIVLGKYDDNKFLVEVNTAKFNELFKQDGISYIEPYGTNGLDSRYEDVGKYLETGLDIDAVKVCITEMKEGQIRASVIDGRHRFAYLRDLGLETMPVCLDKNSLKIAKKYGLV